MSSTQQKPISIAMLALFLVIFIDSMGFGLLFPILNEVLLDPSVNFMSHMTPMGDRVFWFGITLSIFMLCWFFGATIIGDISDLLGRKKALVICLVGGFIGYVLSAVGVAVHLISLLIVGRMVAGFTAGSQPVAQAAIIDLSTPENKASYIGYILLASCVGFALGPVLGAVLANSNLVSWFDFTTPLYAAALLSLFNAILLMIMFKETFVRSAPVSIKWYRAVNAFISAFRHPTLKRLSVVLFLMILSWNGFFSYISLFVLTRFNFTPSEVSLYMADLGVGFAIGCGYLVGFCSERFSLKSSTMTGIIFAAIFIALIAWSHVQWIAWVCVLCVGASIGVAYSNIVTMFSNQVDDNHQGWVMGVAGSVMAMGAAISMFSLSFVVTWGVSIPLISAFIGLLLTACVLWHQDIAVDASCQL